MPRKLLKRQLRLLGRQVPSSSRASEVCHPSSETAKGQHLKARGARRGDGPRELR